MIYLFSNHLKANLNQARMVPLILQMGVPGNCASEEAYPEPVCISDFRNGFWLQKGLLA